ncbi:unnamed protein product [Lampetra planeri]
MGDKDFMWALKNGDLDVVRDMVTQGADVNRLLEAGRRPLHYAADSGQLDILKFLLSNGADVNCSESSHEKCSKLLVSAVDFIALLRFGSETSPPMTTSMFAAAARGEGFGAPSESVAFCCPDAFATVGGAGTAVGSRGMVKSASNDNVRKDMSSSGDEAVGQVEPQY